MGSHQKYQRERCYFTACTGNPALYSTGVAGQSKGWSMIWLLFALPIEQCGQVSEQLGKGSGASAEFLCADWYFVSEWFSHQFQKAGGSTKSYQSDCQQRDLVIWWWSLEAGIAGSLVAPVPAGYCMAAQGSVLQCCWAVHTELFCVCRGLSSFACYIFSVSFKELSLLPSTDLEFCTLTIWHLLGALCLDSELLLKAIHDGKRPAVSPLHLVCAQHHAACGPSSSSYCKRWFKL